MVVRRGSLMTQVVSTRRRVATAAVVALLALALTAPAPAGADAVGATYQRDALDLCPDGELECVDETLSELRNHTRALVDDCDHNAVFAALYTFVTQEYHDTVTNDTDFFGDTAFVNREDRVFAHYYLGAYRNWVDGYRSMPYVPPAWQQAFAAAAGGEVTAAGNLVLGVNAHVVRDLPFVLAGLGLGSKQDHDRVNEILLAAYGPGLEAIDAHLADAIDQYDLQGTELDDRALFELVAGWREQAWQDAQALADADSESRRQVVASQIERKAAEQARTFRAQYAYPPGTAQREQREAYCDANAWPPDWLG